MFLNQVNLLPRTSGYLLVVRRTWFKKGEYQLKRPHGLSLNSFRAGDGWNWLSVRNFCQTLCIFVRRIIMSIWIK